MTVERGRTWGTAGTLPSGAAVVHNDREARALVEAARREGRPVPALGLLGGDLCRTLGGRGDAARLHGPEATQFRVDMGAALIDGERHWFVGHLVARRSWWRGRVLAVMNAQWLGAWDVAPRSHPGDGRFDVYDADLSLDDRIKARSRLRTGTHVPHPEIQASRASELLVDLDPALDVYLDGVRMSRARHVAVTIEPEALLCVV